MAQTDSDRNLLFGILALQLDLVGRNDLIEAMNAWVLEKSVPLRDILVERGALDRDDCDLLEPLIARHLRRHGDDAGRCLGSLSPLCEPLGLQGDHDLEASVAKVRVTQIWSADTPPTEPFSSGPGPRATPGDRYRILRWHARGGIGEVYVARDEEIHRDVALKEIQDGLADRAEIRSRFLLEAEVTGRLEHPGIVPVYSLGHHPDGRPFYAMRFIKGNSLRHAIDAFHADGGAGDPGGRVLELRMLLGRLVDVCNAIAYAHSRGVLHRDLKPANVMLGQYGETLVVDWGMAKAAGRSGAPEDPIEATLRPSSGSRPEQTRTGDKLGTPAYMSPEQAAGRVDQIGPASDVYSLGATLYCLLTGRIPFMDSDVYAVLQRVCQGDFPPPRQIRADVPRPLEAICLKAMALRPEDRYPSARALADDLEHWLADEPVAAWREPAALRLARWGRRHRLLVTGATVASIVTAVALAIGTASIERQRRETEETLGLALESVDRYMQVAHNWLADQPRTDLEQRSLLESSLVVYEAVARQVRRDPMVRFRRATAEHRIGETRFRLGSVEEAEVPLRSATAALRQLIAERPTNREYRRALAACETTLGKIAFLSDRGAEAESAWRRAAELFSALAEEFRDDRVLRVELAKSQSNLALFLFQGAKKIDEARAMFDQALVTLGDLAADASDDAAARRVAGTVYHNLGLLFAEIKKGPKATEAMQEAVKLRERLLDDRPSSPTFRQELARSRMRLASFYNMEKRRNDAESELGKAIPVQETLVNEFSQVTSYRFDLYCSYCEKAKILLQKGEKSAWEAYLHRALELVDWLHVISPDRADYRKELIDLLEDFARVLRLDGRSQEAEGFDLRARQIKEPPARPPLTGRRADGPRKTPESPVAAEPPGVSPGQGAVHTRFSDGP
jgi:tetratricopeptide (TPR) repeat protein/tRNA A-37 threonylcarbamoyl transferase component Bud32